MLDIFFFFFFNLFSDGKVVSRKTDWWEVASKAPVPGGDYYGTMFESEKADHFGQKHLYTKVQSTGLGKQNGASTILWSWGTCVPH